MSEASVARRLAAEALGTGLLVATVIGSGIMAERLAGGNVAIALLGNTIPTGAVLVVLITALGPVSGAHFNPAVSLVFATRGALARPMLAGYVAAQAGGALAGAALAHAMFETPVFQMGATVRSGVGQWIAEATATFTLVFVILAGLRFRPDAIPWLVGLTVTAAYWFTASTSFANPAVTFARAFSDSFAGIRLADVPAFAAAQVAGALFASAAAAWLVGRPRD